MALPDPINTGTAPNNGTGDPLRTAFQKSNTREDYLEVNKEDKANKGVANGYPPLDGNIQIPEQYIPFDSILAQKVQVSTGTITDPTPTINTDPTLADIPAFKGFKTNVSDPENPVTERVDYPGFTGYLSPFLNTHPTTYVAIDPYNNNTIVAQTTPFSNSQRRSLLICGILVHTGNTTIETVNSYGNYIVSPTSQLHDKIDWDGAEYKGNRVTANGTGLQINKDAGYIFKNSINPETQNPHERLLAQVTAATFRYRLQDSTEFSDTQSVDPNNYDNAGTLTSVPPQNWTYHRVAVFQSNAIRLQYPDRTYATANAAQLGLVRNGFPSESNIADNGITIAYLFMRQGITNLQTAIANETAFFIYTDKSGDIQGGAGSGTSIGYTPEDVANKTQSITGGESSDIYPSVPATEARYTPNGGNTTDTAQSLRTDIDTKADKRLSNLAADLSTIEKNSIKSKLSIEATQLLDNLTSTSTTAGLTANQGRILKGFIDDINSRQREIKEVSSATYTFQLEDKNKIIVFTADCVFDVPSGVFAKNDVLKVINAANNVEFTTVSILQPNGYTKKIKSLGWAELLCENPSTLFFISGDFIKSLETFTDVISYALSSPTADLTAGDTDSFIAPYNFTLDNYFVGVAVAPTGSALVIGLKKNGTSVTSSDAIIDATETTSLTGTAPVLTTQSFVKGDLITPVISQVGSLDTGKSLKIYLEITKS